MSPLARYRFLFSPAMSMVDEGAVAQHKDLTRNIALLNKETPFTARRLYGFANQNWKDHSRKADAYHLTSSDMHVEVASEGRWTSLSAS